MACNPSFVVFDSACKKLLLKFMPSIAEVVAEIERQNRRWNKRFSALDGIEDCYEELVQLIAQSEVAVAAAEQRERNIEKPRQRRWSSVIDLELALERIARGRVAFLAVARRLI